MKKQLFTSIYRYKKERMNQKTKVVVDDDPDVLFATARVIRNADYEVIEASTGIECIQMAKKNSPDLIMLDVMLPDIEGTAVCKRIKEDPFLKGIYIILISGAKIASGDQAEGLESGKTHE
jgi:CheY-like chemotaxis protein